MPAFQRPFNPQAVAVAEGALTLPDRYSPDAPPGTRFARFGGSLLHVLIATPAGASPSFDFQWPVTGVSRVVDVTPADAAALGIAEMAELSPLPFGIASVLRALLPGIPTFYIGLAGSPLPPQDELARTTDAPLPVTRAVIGAIFQDGATLEPWAWVDLIGNALPDAEAADWRLLAALWSGRRTLRVLNAAGRPANETFTIRHVDAGGNPTSTTTVQSSAAGDLGSIFSPPAGQRTEIVWVPSSPPAGGSLPVIALYEGSIAAPGDDAMRAIPPDSPDSPVTLPVTLTLPDGFSGGHLQILDLAQWFSDVQLTPDRAWPARFRSQSRFQGLVDGPPVFRRLFPEMEAALGVHLAGWAFKEFPLVPDNPESSLLKLIEKDRGKYRLLVTQFFRPRTGALTGATTASEMAILYFAALAIANPLIVLDVQDGDADIRGALTFQALVALAYAAAMFVDVGENLESRFRRKAERTDEDVREDVYVKTPLIGYPSRHLARIADNPVSGNLPLPDGRSIADLQQHFSVHHTKMQVLCMTDQPPTYIGYVGGTDINSNRVNSPGHQGSGFRKPDSTSPPTAVTFHDVHARITGLAAYDVAGIYQDRYEFESEMGDDGTVQDPLFNQTEPRLEPAFTLDDTPVNVQPDGSHLVQVARTTYAPATGSTGYPWSSGEAPIRFTFERAVHAAREYIYIEEQYLTPDDGFVAALRNAADHCRRLLILVPASPDQPFGDQRRLAIVERLSGTTGGPGGWGDRLIVGTPFRRPVLAPAQRQISHGRMTLLEAVTSASQPELFVGPFTRVPTSTPYFFWVGGELMCAVKTQKVTSPGGHEAMRIEVLRGGLGTQPRWCPHPRQHAAGTPVTVAEPRAIFVHSKMMIVDDIFVGVGSANYNRRGHFHDGEVTAFAIPDRLRAAADNPALQLRTELWAEHLGISPEMGRALLADPIAAFELFRRSRYQGNRLTPFHEFRIPPAELASLATHKALALLPLSVRVMLLATLQAGLMTQIPDLWNTLSDPTTNVDPNPTPGPGLP